MVKAVQKKFVYSRQITGVVDRLNYSSQRFSAGFLADSDGNKINFSGPVYFGVGDFVTLFGDFEHDPKWGKQFKAVKFEYATSSGSNLTIDGLAHYLAVSKDFQGIGKAKAAILANEFGANFEEALEKKPHEMAKLARMSIEQIELIRDVWRKNSYRNSTATWLAQFELTESQINKIIDAFGGNAIKSLTDDPYQMIDIIDGFGFVRVDEIARKMGVSKEHGSRLRAGILHTVKEDLQEGSTWIKLDDLIDRSNKLLILDCLDSKHKIQQCISGLMLPYKKQTGKGFEAEYESILLLEGDDKVCLRNIYNQEKEVLENLQKYSIVRSGISDIVVRYELNNLNVEQLAAVKGALENPAIVITGSAGVGKTFTIAAIIKEYMSRGKNKVSLCAPTGKAAQRITESINRHGIFGEKQEQVEVDINPFGDLFQKPEPISFLNGQTIHKLLAYNGSEWGFSEHNRLPSHLVIVDEFSMVSTELFYRLLKAIDPGKTNLILVGDPNQLPPIGYGNPLRDIINNKIIPVFALTQIMRQAGELKENCNLILNGVVKPHRNKLDEGEFPAWFLMDSKKNTEAVDCQKLVLSLFRDKEGSNVCPLERLIVPGKDKIDLQKDVQILVPQHKGDVGTEMLNIKLQPIIQKKVYNVEAEEFDASGRSKKPPFLVGDKVIQIKNDYKIGVMNGTVGIIFDNPSYAKEKDLFILFDGHDEPKLISGDAKSNLAHANALTVHKMQGSEIPVVICVFHKSHSFSASRAMMYTAVTRAKNICILIGDPWGLRKIADTISIDRRRTLLDVWTKKESKVELI